MNARKEEGAEARTNSERKAGATSAEAEATSRETATEGGPGREVAAAGGHTEEAEAEGLHPPPGQAGVLTIQGEGTTEVTERDIPGEGEGRTVAATGVRVRAAGDRGARVPKEATQANQGERIQARSQWRDPRMRDSTQRVSVPVK